MTKTSINKQTISQYSEKISSIDLQWIAMCKIMYKNSKHTNIVNKYTSICVNRHAVQYHISKILGTIFTSCMTFEVPYCISPKDRFDKNMIIQKEHPTKSKESA